MNTQQFKAQISAYYYDNYMKTKSGNINKDAVYKTLKSRIPSNLDSHDYESCVKYIVKLIKF